MISHYLKLAFKNLKKAKLHTAINIISLSISFAATFLILLFIIHELSFDKHNKKRNEIYRVIRKYHNGDEIISFAGAPSNFGPILKDQIPEVVDQCRLSDFFLHDFSEYKIVDKNGNRIKETKFRLVDNSIFNILTIPFIEKQQANILLDNSSIVISQKTAKKYFGNENPIGQSLDIETKSSKKSFIIKGVFKNLPETSTFQANILGSIDMINLEGSDEETFLLLSKNSKIAELEAKLNKTALNLDSRNDVSYSLQSLNDIYFYSGYISGNSFTGNIKNVYIFIIIAIAISFIAISNFTITSTARAKSRALEIGVRKTFGAKRGQIIKQVFIESLLVCLIALPTAIVLSELSLPVANQIFSRELKIEYLNNLQYLSSLILATLITALISGLYISLFLSRFEPIKILNNQSDSNPPNILIRKVLITIQLSIFICLIICSIFVNKQIEFAQNKNLGFDRKNLVTININSKVDLFSTEIKSNPNIIKCGSAIQGILSRLSEFDAIYSVLKPTESFSFRIYDIGAGYLETLGVKLQGGDNMLELLYNDSSKVIINETGAKILGFDNPIGQIISAKDRDQRFQIVGVIKDFNISSVREKVPPIIIRSNNSPMQLIIRTREGHLAEAISFIEKKWKEFFPNKTFRYYIIDDVFRNQYKSELNFAYSIRVFTLLSIAVAALGLFGLSKLLIEQKTKEIGIRKVFGANTISIIRSISKNLIQLTIIANIIAWPIGWYLMDLWLQNFAYKINTDIRIYFATGLTTIAFVMTILTINTYRSAMDNPIKSLKYE